MVTSIDYSLISLNVDAIFSAHANLKATWNVNFVDLIVQYIKLINILFSIIKL